MDKFESLREKMRTAIDRLPQRAAIQERVIEPWIEGVITLDPDRALWHVDRLRGFGGSEAGELLRHMHGEGFYLQPPENIIQSKLLLRLPERSNVHMARGSDLEEVVQRAYWKHAGVKSVLGDPEVSAVFGRPREDLPCAVGNPDDVVIDAQSRLFIPDFKVRSSLDWDSDLEINYIAQCHWYAGIYEANSGTKIDGLMLAELDIPTATADGMRDALKFLTGDDREAALDRFATVINEMSLPGFGLRVTEFDYSKKLLSDLDEIAKTLWEKHVMTGHPLIQESKKRTELPVEASNRLQEIERNFLKYKLIKESTESKEKTIAAEAQQILAEHDADTWESGDIGVNFGYSQKFNAESAALALIAQGAEKKDLMKTPPLDAVEATDIDPEKALAALKNHGLLNESVLKDNWHLPSIKKQLKQAETLDETQFIFKVPRAALSQTKEGKAFRANLAGKVADSLESIEVLEPLDADESLINSGSSPSLA